MYKIKHLKTVDSTNTFCKRNIEIIEDKTCVFAHRQTQGKGRFNRKWISDVENNIYLSIVLKPNFKNVSELPLANLTQYMSVCLAKNLEQYDVNPKIKWPNDVMVNEAKISGILSQCVWKNSKLEGFILGLGVNLNLAKDDLEKIDQKATSLNLEIGKSVNCEIFSRCLLDEFFKNYDAFLEKGFLLIKQDYCRRFLYLNKPVCISLNLEKNISGIIKEINDDGTLSVCESKTNDLKVVSIGDLTCLKF